MKKNLIMIVVAIAFTPIAAQADAFSGATYIMTTVNNNNIYNTNINVSPFGFYPYGFSPYSAPLGFYTSGAVFNNSTAAPQDMVNVASPVVTSPTSSNASSTSYAVAGQMIQQQSQGGPYTSAQQGGNALTDSILNTIFLPNR